MATFGQVVSLAIRPVDKAADKANKWLAVGTFLAPMLTVLVHVRLVWAIGMCFLVAFTLVVYAAVKLQKEVNVLSAPRPLDLSMSVGGQRVHESGEGLKYVELGHCRITNRSNKDRVSLGLILVARSGKDQSSTGLQVGQTLSSKEVAGTLSRLLFYLVPPSTGGEEVLGLDDLNIPPQESRYGNLVFWSPLFATLEAGFLREMIEKREWYLKVTDHVSGAPDMRAPVPGIYPGGPVIDP